MKAKIGEIHKVHHSRKGEFDLFITEISDEWRS